MQPIEVMLGGEAVKLTPPAPDLRVLFVLYTNPCISGDPLDPRRTVMSWAALGLCLPGGLSWDGQSVEDLVTFGRRRFNALCVEYSRPEVMIASWQVLGALFEDFTRPTKAEVAERRDFTKPALANSG